MLKKNGIIYDYWDDYEAHKSNKTVRPRTLIEYFRIGIDEFQISGEKTYQIEWIVKGLRRLINKAKKTNYILATGNIFASMQKELSQEQNIELRELMKGLSDFDTSINEDNWKDIIDKLKILLEIFDISSYDNIKMFWKWIPEENIAHEGEKSQKKSLANHYIYTDEKSGRTVDLEFGSIHSVKGRTHLSTLVLETYLRTHNMKKILKYLNGTLQKSVDSDQKRLKCQYVAMTRARALICLAIPLDFVDDKMQEKLKSVGWKIEKI